jgi:diaminopimelate epimerase
MKIEFKKYSATGNDFIVIDNRSGEIELTAEKISALCQRKSGIGADGILFLENSNEHDFKMKIFNADGGEASMCGNGSRCLTMFYHEDLGHNKKSYSFETKAGVYQSVYEGNGMVSVLMTEFYDVEKYQIGHLLICKESMYLNTGVAHSVFLLDSIKEIAVDKEGARIRNDQLFQGGTNVNFIEITGKNQISMRTFEKGVEAETLSCGTGAVASAIFMRDKMKWQNDVFIKTQGGDLIVSFRENKVYFKGEVLRVFSGFFEKE